MNNLILMGEFYGIFGHINSNTSFTIIASYNSEEKLTTKKHLILEQLRCWCFSKHMWR